MTARRAQRSRASARARETKRGALAKHGRGLLHLAVALIGFAVCGLLSLQLGQDNNWDLRNYHYYNPYAFLHDRIGFDLAPAQRQSYMNPIVDLPFYLGSNHLNPRLFGFLIGGIQGLSLGLIFAICFVVFRQLSSLHRTVLSAACAGLGVHAPVLMGQLGGSQNDVLVSLPVLASVWLFVRTLAAKGTLDDAGARRSLIAASCLMGLAVGFKLTTAVHALAVTAAILVVESTWRHRARVSAAWCIAFALGFLVANGYWMARLWQEFHNPFFPFYNNVFNSPWADARAYTDRSMVPETLKQAVALPVVLSFKNPYTIFQGQFHDARYAVLYVLLIALGLLRVFRFVRARRATAPSSRPGWPADARFLLVFFVISFVLWEANFNIIRYTASLEALAPLLIVIVVFELSRRAWVRAPIIAATFVFTAVTMQAVRQDRIAWGKTFWDVQAPVLADAGNALILIANDRPLAYLIPFIAPEARWVGLNNNFTSPTRLGGTQDTIRRLIRDHRDLYLLTRAPSRAWQGYDERILAFYDLAVAGEKGLPIKSRHTKPGLQLLRLRRLPPGSFPNPAIPDRGPRG